MTLRCQQCSLPIFSSYQSRLNKQHKPDRRHFLSIYTNKNPHDSVPHFNLLLLLPSNHRKLLHFQAKKETTLPPTMRLTIKELLRAKLLWRKDMVSPDVQESGPETCRRSRDLLRIAISLLYRAFVISLSSQLNCLKEFLSF